MSFSLHNQFQLGLSNDPSYLFTAARFLAFDSNPPRKNLADHRKEEEDSSAVTANVKLTNPARKLSLIQGVGVAHSPFISSSASLFAGSSRAFGSNASIAGTLGTQTWIFSADNTGPFDSVKMDGDNPLPVYNQQTWDDWGIGLQDTRLPDYGSNYSAYFTPCAGLPGPVINFPPDSSEPPSQTPVLPIQSIAQNTPYSNCPGTAIDQSLKIASLVSPIENEIFYNPDADGIISGDLKITEFPKMIGGTGVITYTSTNNTNFTVTYATGASTGDPNFPLSGNFGGINISLTVNDTVALPLENSVTWSVIITPSTQITPMGVDTMLTLTAAQLQTDLTIPILSGIITSDLVIRLTEDNFANGTPFTDRNPKNLGKLKNISVLQPKIMNAAGHKAFTQQISKTNENIFQLPGDFTPTLILPPSN